MTQIELSGPLTCFSLTRGAHKSWITRHSTRAHWLGILQMPMGFVAGCGGTRRGILSLPMR